MEEEQQMLLEAVNEIRSLRRQNEILSAKQEVFDSMMAVLHTQIATKSQGMSPDLVWKIEKYLAKQTQKVNA